MKRLPLAAILAAFFIFLILEVSVRQSVLLLVGVGMGAALAGARFGFTTGWRQLIEQRNPQGVTGQVLLLALASLAALPLLGQFSELHAALGPPSVSLLVGAFVFGLTMQIADGCGSGTLYKAGLGVPLNMGILPLFALGSFLGSVHLDSWLSLGQMEPVSLSEQLGTSGALGLTLALLAKAFRGELVQQDPADEPASELLQRRPDLAAARSQLEAAQARVGEARAAWWPSLTLTAQGGGVSSELSNLLKSGAGTWGPPLLRYLAP